MTGPILPFALDEYLSGAPELADFHNGRVWPMSLPQLPQPPILPALVHRAVSGVRLEAHNGPSGINRSRVQIDCWGNTVVQAQQMAEAVRRSLDGFRGTMGGNGSAPVTVQMILLMNQIDLHEPQSNTYHIALDFDMVANEDVR